MREPTETRDGEDIEYSSLLPASTHSGLADVDPWGESAGAPGGGGRAALGGLWPWGLEQVSETLEVIALAVIMFLAVRAVGQNFVVDGRSMLPTFDDGELLIVNRLAYRTFDLSWLPGVGDEWQPFGEPEAGDVVVFEFPRNPERDFIKRVIAVPGQTVEIREGQVFVDGEVLDEPYVLDQPSYPYGPEVVPPGHVFVLGDNRNNSFDSHSWGMLETSLIIGRADIRYWPFERIGLIDHTDPHPGGTAEVERPSPSSSAAQTGAATSP